VAGLGRPLQKTPRLPQRRRQPLGGGDQAREHGGDVARVRQSGSGQRLGTQGQLAHRFGNRPRRGSGVADGPTLNHLPDRLGEQDDLRFGLDPPALLRTASLRIVIGIDRERAAFRAGPIGAFQREPPEVLAAVILTVTEHHLDRHALAVQSRDALGVSALQHRHPSVCLSRRARQHSPPAELDDHSRWQPDNVSHARQSGW